LQFSAKAILGHNCATLHATFFFGLPLFKNSCLAGRSMVLDQLKLLLDICLDTGSLA
jgi:hypothetical protein